MEASLQMFHQALDLLPPCAVFASGKTKAVATWQSLASRTRCWWGMHRQRVPFQSFTVAQNQPNCDIDRLEGFCDGLV